MVKFIQKHFISVSFCIILFFIIAIIIANFNIVYLIVKKSDKNISEQCSLEKETIDENIENNMNELVEESENKKYSDSAKQDDTLSRINIYRTNKWRIKIPVLGLDAPISQGTSSEELRRTVGHFEETDKWDGNVALAAHNRGYKCNFFQEIRKLKDGDTIVYSTDKGQRQYKVVLNKVIKETDWTYIQNTKDNRLTLITCEMNKREYRRCVQAVEI